MFKNKIEEQKIAIEKWVNSNYSGTINAVTGFGKCKVGIDAINLVYTKLLENTKNDISKFKILIVTPTTEIKKEWVKELKKWKCEHLLQFIDIQCIKTCYKFNNKKYSLGIFDEVHNYIGNTYSNVFKNNYFKRKICLSASIPSVHYDYLYNVLKCPIIYTMSIDKALKLNLINDFKVYNLGIELSFKERKSYNNLTRRIDENSLKGFKSWDLIGMRKNIIYSAENKFKILTVLEKHFSSYGIIFTQSKEAANKVSSILNNCLVHHSGFTTKNRNEIIKTFSDGRTKEKILSTAMTLDEGVSLPRLQFAIILANTSKEKQFIQRVGRVVRLEKGKKESIILRVYCKNTVEEQWIKKSQSSTKNIFIRHSEIEKIWI
jgi:superfamily II DNA or RNA helicase